MPYIQSSLIVAIQEISVDFPNRFRNDLTSIVLDLCHPDPSRRGRANSAGASVAGLLWLQRYASRFDILEKASRIRVAVKNA